MSWLVRMRADMRERLRGALLTRKVDAELEEELRFHMEQETTRLVRQGVPEDEARRQAAATFGGVERYKDEVRDARGLAWLPGLKLDFALGIRMMKKNPAISLVGGFGMSLGVALAVGMFVFMRAHMFTELPLDEGDRIVAIEVRDTLAGYQEEHIIHDLVIWRRQMKSIQDIGAFLNITRNLQIGEAPPEPVHLAEMSAAGFRVARVAPLLGRYLLDEDERAEAEPVVVIGYEPWQRRFFGRRDVIGERVRLGGVMHTIVGVMPEDFGFPRKHSMWVPLKANPAAFPRRNGYEYFAFGRLAKGATMKSAQAELSALGRQIAAENPESATLVPSVVGYIPSITGMHNATMMAIQSQLMMSLLLVVVALNVAMLVYARTATRQGEIAVRTALGASRKRIVSQLFIEALTLSGSAAVAGLVIALIGINIADWAFAGDADAFWIRYRVEPVTLLFTAGLAVFAAVIVGVMPALQATGKRLQVSLRSMTGTGMRLGATWTALVVAQVAIAVAVIPPAIDFAWSELSKAFTETSFEPLQYVEAPLDSDGVDGMGRLIERTGEFGDRLHELIRQVEAEPNVAGATYTATDPRANYAPLEVEGIASPPGTSGHVVKSMGVSLDYLDLFEVKRLAGRALEIADADTASSSVVVNRAFVDQVMGGVNPLGHRLRYAAVPSGMWQRREPGRWFRVVGVVENLERNAWNPKVVKPLFFYAVGPRYVHRAGMVHLVVRSRSGNAAVLGPRLRQIASGVDPTFRLGTIQTREDLMRETRLMFRLMSLVMGVVLISVMLLSAAGIYALVSFTVTRRRKEIGIRTALGAREGQVLRDVLGRVGGQIAGGVLVGLIGAVAIDRVSGGSLLTGVQSVLLPSFGILMAIVALLAAFGPARRGLKIQPTEALRAEA